MNQTRPVADFEKDKNLSDKMKPFFDDFYKSEKFRDKYITPLYKKYMGVYVKEISRSDELKLQIGVQCDAVLKLSNGNRILVDDKIRRYEYLDLSNWVIETVSNTTKKTDGWGYKKGVVICYGQINQNKDGLIGDPFCFTITTRFIDEITRNNNYGTAMRQNPYYWTVMRKVPRTILERYYD